MSLDEFHRDIPREVAQHTILQPSRISRDLPDNLTEPCQHFIVTNEIIESYLRPEYEQIYTFLVIPFVAIFGLLTNLSFLFVFTRVLSIRNGHSFLLVQLAISDSLFLVTDVGNKVLNLAMSPIIVDQGWAPRSYFISCLFLAKLFNFGSMFTITLISFERYFAVCQPLKRFTEYSIRKSVYNSIFVWLVSASLASVTIPVNLKYEVYCPIWPTVPEFYDLPEMVTYYIHYSNGVTISFHIIQTLPFAIALITNCVLFVKIRRALSKRSQKFGENNSTNAIMTQHDRTNHRVTIMLLIVGVTFFLLLLPFQIGSTLFALSHLINRQILSQSVNRIFYVIAYTLVCLNAGTNPVIYNVVNRQYRKALKQAFNLNC